MGQVMGGAGQGKELTWQGGAIFKWGRAGQVIANIFLKF